MIQLKVQPDEEETYFALKKSIFWSRKKNEQPRYYTEISVLIHFYDIKNETSLGYLEVEGGQNGLTPEKSKAEALKMLRLKLIMELKKIYWLSSELELSKEGKNTIKLGTKQGILKEMIFEISEPETIWTEDSTEYIVPAGRIGYASIVDTSSDSSTLKIIRQWQDCYPDCWVTEFPYSIHAIQLNCITPSVENFFSLGISFQARSIQKIDCGLGMQFIRLTDSSNENDYGVGFSCFGLWRFLMCTKFNIAGKIGVNFDVPFKKDDYNQTVNTIIFSTQIGLNAEIPISPGSDFVIGLGYRWGTKSSTWQYSVEEETFDAYWLKEPPVVNNTGIILSFRYKYLFY